MDEQKEQTEKKIEWKFTKQKADEKLSKHYI